MKIRTCRDPEGWWAVSRWRQFDSTPCFEEGVLLSTILVLAVVLGAFQSNVLFSREPNLLCRKSRWVLRFKLAVLAVLTGVGIANAVRAATHKNAVAVWQSYILEPIAFAVISLLTWTNHHRSRRSSTLILIFWPVYFVALVIWGRTTIARRDVDLLLPMFTLKSVVLGIGGISLILECLGTEFSPRDGHDKYESPTSTANIYSLWTFSWLTPLMRKGAKEYITEDDLPSLLPADESRRLGEDLEKASAKHTALWKALFFAYGGPYLTAALLKVIQDGFSFLQPQLLRWLLDFISDYQDARTGLRPNARRSPVEGFAIALIMFIAATVRTILVHQYFQRVFETGMRVRAGLVQAIYKKSLVLSTDERGRGSGDIVNLMSVDATRLQDLCTYGLMVISGPVQIILAFVSLYNILGWSAFVGVAIMIVSIALNTFVARTLKRMQTQQMKNRDKRTRLMSELLANIKSIKLYAWEFAFIRRILQVRNDEELKMLKKIGIVTSLNSTMWSGIPLLVAFSSFAVAAAVRSEPLTSSVIFPSMSLFMLLQFPFAMFSQVTSNLIEAWVSIKRLSEFLNAEELQADAVVVNQKAALAPNDEVLSIRDGEFYWSKEEDRPTLEGIDFTVRREELVGVLGRVGAGKSSLLSAVVGDMRRTEGTVTTSGCVAYAPQNPWIMSASVRDNILFSHQYDEGFYELVLEACALKQDLALLPQGDLTEVGEKGITLSGGQRARLSLARAVYARADLTLLDDVLAAVDSHVARHIFDHVIGPYGLLASKARVVVLNSISFLGQFDLLVYLRRGIILESGTYPSLMADPRSEICKLVQGHGTSGTSSGYATPFHPTGKRSPAEDEDTAVETSEDAAENTSLGAKVSEKLTRKQSYPRAPLAEPPATRSVSTSATQEHSEQGRVKKTVYLEYVKAASKTGFTLFVLATVLQQVASVGANLALRAWGEHNQHAGDNSGMFRYLLTYGLLSLSSTLMSGAAALFIWVLCSIRSARNLHDSMLNSIMRAPLSFFELTPTGRVMNLFSRDTYVIDSVLGRVIQSAFMTAATTVSITVVIGASFPPFLIAVIPLAWFYGRVMTYYLATSRELKRLDAVSRSPIFAWFSESLAGVSTIRAFGQQAIFIANNERRVDRNQICYLPSISVNRWLAVRLEFVGSVIIVITAVLAVTALITTGVDAGLVGLVLSYALNTTSSLNWVVRAGSDVEQNIVSVERILHYIQLESEAPYEIAEGKPDEKWPSAGEVTFTRYSTRYRPELDMVLRDISMTVKPREKIGVCGRTGAGKSSLLLALFRIIEPASGTIFVDSVDITKIGLHNLRSAISIVPQSPDLFEGTLRENIDPIGEHQDADIWIALEQSHLKDFVESLPGGPDAPVREGGSSLSSGQRQLLCFARALLRKSKILVLDEATSAVDLDTDKAIQEIILGPIFADVTMFTIAHRLNTIIDSDRILVLDNGKIAELDAPQTLLADKNTKFYSLAAEAGLVNGS